MQRKPTYEELEQRVKELEAKLSEENTEWAILRRLAEEWDTMGSPGIIDNSDLISQLGISSNEASPALAMLVANGAVDKDQLGYASYLTPEGYELVKGGTPNAPIADQIRKIRRKHRFLDP